jgi:hypothetical protein
MNVIEWSRIHDQLGNLQIALRAPHDLMMFKAKTDDVARDDIYIGLPSANLLASFPGFEKVDRASLPDVLSTLLAREDGFEERFPDIFQKRRSNTD